MRYSKCYISQKFRRSSLRCPIVRLILSDFVASPNPRALEICLQSLVNPSNITCIRSQPSIFGPIIVWFFRHFGSAFDEAFISLSLSISHKIDFAQRVIEIIFQTVHMISLNTYWDSKSLILQSHYGIMRLQLENWESVMGGLNLQSEQNSGQVLNRLTQSRCQ